MLNNIFIFEGPDGAGKTTIIKSVQKKLIKDGYKCMYLSFPGNQKGTLGKLVYNIHHTPNKFKHLSQTSLQMLHVAAHIDCIENYILPNISSKIILLDRWWWSLYSYGKLYGVNSQVLNGMIDIENLYWEKIKPRKLFYINSNKSYKDEKANNDWQFLKRNYKHIMSHKQKGINICVVNNVKNKLDDGVKEVYNIIKHDTNN